MNATMLDQLAKAARAAPPMVRTPVDGQPGAEAPATTPADPRSPLTIARELRKQFESSRSRSKGVTP